MASKALLLTAMLLMAGIAAPHVLHAEAVLSIEPSDTTVYQGDLDFMLHVYVDSGAVDLMGYNISVHFPDSLLEVVSVTEGSLPANSGHETFFYWLNQWSGDDSVHVNGAILGKTVDGPGVLFDITFRALNEGFADIEIISSDLRNDLNERLVHTDSTGTVCILKPIGTEESTWGLIKIIFNE